MKEKAGNNANNNNKKSKQSVIDHVDEKDDGKEPHRASFEQQEKEQPPTATLILSPSDIQTINQPIPPDSTKSTTKPIPTPPLTQDSIRHTLNQLGCNNIVFISLPWEFTEAASFEPQAPTVILDDEDQSRVLLDRPNYDKVANPINEEVLRRIFVLEEQGAFPYPQFYHKDCKNDLEWLMGGEWLVGNIGLN